jgi:hypothetical protein
VVVVPRPQGHVVSLAVGDDEHADQGAQGFPRLQQREDNGLVLDQANLQVGQLRFNLVAAPFQLPDALAGIVRPAFARRKRRVEVTEVVLHRFSRRERAYQKARGHPRRQWNQALFERLVIHD